MTLELPEWLMLALKVVHTFVAGACGLLGVYLFFAGWRDKIFTKSKPELPHKAQAVLVLTLTLGLFSSWFAALAIAWTWK